jgi:8-oxo-dGTP pyrophosphatase MutT (NUDIX family)
MTTADRVVSRESADAHGPVTAAGAVVFGSGRRVLLVHRPKYDDWSFPKGKVDRGEHVTGTAVREVAEETGVHVRLGVPLDPQHYPVLRGEKTVHYWVGRAISRYDVERFRANAEVDRVAWVDVDLAAKRLTYPHDVGTLEQALERRRKTRTLVVVRHAGARARRTWKGDDRLRPLLRTGATQAQRLVPILGAYDARHLLSSSSTRCVQTLEPYAATTGWKLATDDRLSEEDASSRRVRRVMDDVLAALVARPASAGAVVVCSHRPVIGDLLEAVGVPEQRLETAEALVMHLRAGAVVAVEKHRGRI